MVALTRWTAAAIAVGAWVVVLHALWSTAPSTDPALDLDAGGRLGMNVEVFLPALGMSVVVLAVALVGGAVLRPDVVAVLVGPASSAFAGWLMADEGLVAYLPGITSELLVGLCCGALGLLLGVLAWRPRRTPAGTSRAAAPLSPT